MEDRQRKLSKNLGNDTHTRNIGNNMFQSQSVETFKIISGEVFLVQPEPAFTQTAVSVNLTKGGILTGVAYPDAFIEPVSGNLHGLYEGPVPGQMVMVAFAEGNSAAPFVVNRYPYQGTGDSFTELDYVAPLTRAGYTAMDVVLGHISGSYLSFNTVSPLPGSVSLHAMTNLIVDANTKVDISSLMEVNISSFGITSISGTVLNLNVGDPPAVPKPFVTWTELNLVMQAWLIKVLAHGHNVTAIGAPTGPMIPIPPAIFTFDLDLSTAATTTVFTG